ncbi:hypothetical protein GALL_499780 [mine drainage metagenome]|uniref:Uncharacterized protein n=1 Tax=mine drainage metagenome TaxID=410659 RepID=A0A1J5PLH9_9ZZZZ
MGSVRCHCSQNCALAVLVRVSASAVEMDVDETWGQIGANAVDNLDICDERRPTLTAPGLLDDPVSGQQPEVSLFTICIQLGDVVDQERVAGATEVRYRCHDGRFSKTNR